MSDCKGRAKKSCSHPCLYTKGPSRKYCRIRSKSVCRGRNIKACYEKNKCKVSAGGVRTFGKKKHNRTKKSR
jgi:hypothetical protein